jgi:hypothetical protein
MEEKNSKFSFRMKIILTSLMIGILIMLAILFNSTVNAYNLPSYDINSESDIESDIAYFTNGKGSSDNFPAFDDKKLDTSGLIYLAENYTERPGYIINYVYIWNTYVDNGYCCYNIKMTLNGREYNWVIDNYTRLPDEEIGDTWLERDYIMTYCSTLFHAKSGGWTNIMKLRMDASVLNLDEKRTYNIREFKYMFMNERDVKEIKSDDYSDFSFSFDSVWNSADRDNPVTPSIDLPLYKDCYCYNDDIYFEFTNSAYNTRLSQIKLNDVVYPLFFVEYDNQTKESIYKTQSIGLKAKGTMTYKINGYYVGDKFYDTSKEDVTFRYVSSLTSVEVEADKTMSHHWAPIGGNYSIVEFYLKEKKTGKAITNATSVHCRYTYKGVKYAPTLNVKDATFGNSFANAFSIMFNGSNKNGVLKKSANADNLYKWGFGIKIPAETFDILTITYQVENQIITGSCYKNGLHIENIDGVDHVFDMNGNNRDKDYGTKDDGLIYGKDKNGNLKDETPTENRPTKYDENFFDKLLDFLNVFFSVTVGVGILILVIQIVSVVANVFRKRG